MIAHLGEILVALGLNPGINEEWLRDRTAQIFYEVKLHRPQRYKRHIVRKLLLCLIVLPIVILSGAEVTSWLKVRIVKLVYQKVGQGMNFSFLVRTLASFLFSNW